jgi:Siphovirus Gp157
MTSLYQLSTDFAQELDTLFDDDGTALPEFEERRALIGSKAREVVAYMLNIESDEKMCAEHIAKVKARQDMLKRKAEHLRSYIASNMKVSGITELKANDGSFCVRLYIDRDESVELDDGVIFAPELCNEPKPPSPSKTKIKAAIKAGEAIEGARLVRKDRLTI